jgi:hypothetical protein
MEIDNVASPQVPGLKDLGISPQSIVPTVQGLLRPTSDRDKHRSVSDIRKIESS